MNFICGKGSAGTIIADVRLDADGDDSVVVGNLLLGDGNAVEVLKGLGCFAQGKTQALCRGRHSDIIGESSLLNLRDEACFGRESRSILKKSTVNWR